MYHPTTRLLAVLEMLQSRGQTSGAELARELGVDGRTLRRYITRLEEMGVPIAVEHGRHGGYALVAGYKLPPMMFTGEEALALSVGLLAARTLGLGHAAPGVASAQAKLERVMPPDLRRRVKAADETITLELPHSSEPADAAALAVLTSAAQTQRRVRMRYRSAESSETERELDPYGLAYRGGCWYVVGHCHLRQGLRSFRLDRVRGVSPTETPFERPKKFDALRHLTFSIAALPRGFSVEVLIRADLAAVRRNIFVTLGALEATPDGVRLLGQTDDLEWFARELSRLPFEFEVQRPAELRGALRTHARTLITRADTPARRRGPTRSRR
jgi:predicted DNA-binding transcriptional regulator YafY